MMGGYVQGHIGNHFRPQYICMLEMSGKSPTPEVLVRINIRIPPILVLNIQDISTPLKRS